jgi:hypothetical protein
MFKPALLLAGLTVCAASPAFADSILNNADRSSSVLNVSQMDNTALIMGLKESLAVASQRAIEQVSSTDGYLNDSGIHIPIPESLKNLAEVMNQVSLGSKVRKFEKSMNSAAEVAAPQAASILSEAITNMTFSDAQSIYSGGDHAATDYLRRVSENKIITAFKPEIEKALVQVDATKHYKVFASEASSIPLVRGNVDLDLTQYVTQKAVDGLFIKLAEQEAAIRKNPVARTTEILQMLWGQ